jgi:hypothetical protein
MAGKNADDVARHPTMTTTMTMAVARSKRFV